MSVADSQRVDASEEFGVRTAHGKPPRVVAQVMIQRVKRTAGLEYLVVEAFGEDAFQTCGIVYLYFEGGYVSAEYFLGFLLHEQKYVQVVGHDGVLKHSDLRLDLREFAQPLLDGRANGRGYNARAPLVALRNPIAAGERAEVRHLRRLVERQHIDAAPGVVMPRCPQQPVSTHRSCVKVEEFNFR